VSNSTKASETSIKEVSLAFVSGVSIEAVALAFVLAVL
jgi:hypothetical protein